METSDTETMLVHTSRADKEYFHQEAGRVYGAKRGSLMKMMHRMIEVYKAHSGEVPVTA